MHIIFVVPVIFLKAITLRTVIDKDEVINNEIIFPSGGWIGSSQETLVNAGVRNVH